MQKNYSAASGSRREHGLGGLHTKTGCGRHLRPDSCVLAEGREVISPTERTELAQIARLGSTL